MATGHGQTALNRLSARFFFGFFRDSTPSQARTIPVHRKLTFVNMASGVPLQGGTAGLFICQKKWGSQI